MVISIFTKYLMHKPLKTKVIMMFLPVIILSVIITGVFSYIVAVRQLRENAYYMLKDTVYQTSTFVNDKFSTMFEQLVYLEGDKALQNLILNRYDDSNKSDKYDDIITMNKKFESIYLSYYQILDSIYLYTRNGTELKLLKDTVPMRIGIDLNEWNERYTSSEKGYYWLNDHEDTVFNTVDKRQVISTFKIFGRKDTEANGIVLFNIKSQYITNILNNVRLSSNGYIMLVNNEGIMTSKAISPRFDIAAPGAELLRKNMGSSGSFTIKSAQGEKMLVVYDTLKINNWTLAAVVPEKDILKDASQIKYISLVVIILLVFISSIIAAVFAASISKSIIYLSRQVRRFEEGDFTVEFDTTDTNEIGILANGLSSMVRTVKSLLQGIKDEQEKKRKVELLALQTQINPHFLYNTLASIKHLVDMNDNDRASKMVSALTKFFMIGISKGKEIITLREELEHVKSYLLIQKMRYQKDFDFSIAVSEDILDCKMIKLTLQPLIENSIYHGMKQKVGPGEIKISGWREEQEVVLEIYDDGVGMDSEKLNQLVKVINTPEIDENPITFGLKNVHQRILLHFGPEYGLTIESKEDEFTRVRVRVPYRKM